MFTCGLFLVDGMLACSAEPELRDDTEFLTVDVNAPDPSENEPPEDTLFNPAEAPADEPTDTASDLPTEVLDDEPADGEIDEPTGAASEVPTDVVGDEPSPLPGGGSLDDRSEEPTEPSTDIPTHEQVLEVLRSLPPLPKPHHYAPSVIGYLPEWRDYTREIVRITRSSGVAGAYGAGRTRLAVQAAVEANESEPDAIPTVLNMYWDPWLVEYRNSPHPPTDFGEQYTSGLERMRSTLLDQRAWIDDANAEFGSDIRVEQFFLEIEFWSIPLDDDGTWAAAVLRRQDECHDMVKSIFPDAKVAWYNRGDVHQKSRDNGLTFYSGNRLFTGAEKGDQCTNTVYSLGRGMDPTLETMRQTIANVDQTYGDDVPVIPFLALGAGYRFMMDNPYTKHMYRVWDYDIVDSYKMGMFINLPIYANSEGNVILGADWNRVPAVMFWPELLDHKFDDEASVNIRMKHFVAYCCGATETPFPTNLWPYR